MVGWLDGQSAGWLVNWLAGGREMVGECLAGLDGWLVGWLTGGLVGWLVG